MTTGKTIALTRQTFVGKVISLLFNMLSRLVRHQNNFPLTGGPGGPMSPTAPGGPLWPGSPINPLSPFMPSTGLPGGPGGPGTPEFIKSLYYHSGSFAGSVSALLSEEQTLHLNVTCHEV